MEKKGISLHIAVEKCDQSHYGKSFDELKACVHDAEAMLEIAKSQGFATHILKDDEARFEVVRKKIKGIAEDLSEGDIFLLTYSGHGTQVFGLSDETKDELLDEGWVLYDQIMFDDTLRYLWSYFNKNRIVVISDSCHSGSMTREAFVDDEERGHSRFIPWKTTKLVLQKHPEIYQNQKRWSSKNSKPITSCVLLISACKDHQVAKELCDRSNGVLTKYLLDVWEDGDFMGTYHDFFKEIKEKVTRRYHQIPNWFPYPEGICENSFIYYEKPFEI
jgi:hypothetical protein